MNSTRRDFLKTISAATAGAALVPATLATAAQTGNEDQSVSFGLFADTHYANIPPSHGSYNRDSIPKLKQAIETFNQRQLPFVVELGDFIDGRPNVAEELAHLRKYNKLFQTFSGKRHYVLGNHCVATVTKEQFLETVESDHKRSYYSFDHGPGHFIVLDANFRRDGVPYVPGKWTWTDTAIPDEQLDWLADDLKKAKDKPTVAFVHQNLDCEHEAHGVKNAAKVRSVLEASGRVAAVFQGHKHTGGYRKINGIHYCTLRAMVKGAGVNNNSYAIVTLDDSGSIRFEPFARQPKLNLT